MANPLFNNMFGGRNNVPTPQIGGSSGFNINEFMSRFKEFQKSFKDDPNKTLDELVSSGKVTKEQVERATNMAQFLKRWL